MFVYNLHIMHTPYIHLIGIGADLSPEIIFINAAYRLPGNVPVEILDFNVF